MTNKNEIELKFYAEHGKKLLIPLVIHHLYFLVIFLLIKLRITLRVVEV